ncbi:MAG: sigma-70 family RNA polymerase sigma factor [Planctomycetes bacterium]|nr:sigma-70 family RNA polymerase sigma factor [Planctomycetota bacterium]
MIVAFARKLGLNEADAADVAQETLTRFITDYRAGKYDRERGRLRSWIIGIVRYRVADLKRSQAYRRQHRGESAMVDLASAEQLNAIWDAERRRTLLWQAIGELRDQTRLTERTIRAFELYVLHERPAEEVARDLGLTPHDVYMAKNRVAERLRETLARLEEIFDDG